MAEVLNILFRCGCVYHPSRDMVFLDPKCPHVESGLTEKELEDAVAKAFETMKSATLFGRVLHA